MQKHSTAVVPFTFESSPIRIVTDGDGEPMFVAKDLVEAVDAVWKGDQGSLPHVPDEWKGVTSVQTPGGRQEMTVLTEQGMYFYLIRSDKPKALPLQKWVSGQVLPSIRRTGGYAVRPVLAEKPTQIFKDFYGSWRKPACKTARPASGCPRIARKVCAGSWTPASGGPSARPHDSGAGRVRAGLDY